MQKLNVLKYYRLIYKECSEIKSYNFRDFFKRKLRYDFDVRINPNINHSTKEGKTINEKDLQLKLEEMKRIKVLQNLFFQNEKDVNKIHT